MPEHTGEGECLEAAIEAGRVPWTGPPCRADLNDVPGFRTIELSTGGTLTIAVDAEGSYRMSLDLEGAHLSFPLAPVDVAGIRSMTGDLVLDHLREVTQ